MSDSQFISKLDYVKDLSIKRLDNFQATTPAMKQYFDTKKAYLDSIVFFRMGDFYEMFFDDAIIVSKELEITLTSRGKNLNCVPLAGIPHHALDNYLGKLVEKGYKVAICEQLEDPKKSTGVVVKRGVTRVITPGTKPSDLVNSNSNNYLLSIYQYGEFYSIGACDLTTNEFYSTIVNYSNLMNEIAKYNPSEIILPESLKLNDTLIKELLKSNFLLNFIDNTHYNFNDNIKLNNLDVVDVDFALSAIERNLNIVVNSIYSYAKTLGLNNLTNEIEVYSVNNYMVIDRVCLRNLELLFNTFDGSSNFTLLHILNKTNTSMGLRFLKKSILRPLYDINEINMRLNFVEELVNNYMLRESMRLQLKEVYDIERLSIKLSSRNIHPKELTSLKKSLININLIKNDLSKFSSKLSKKLNKFENINEIINIIDESIDDSYNYNLSDRGYIKKSYNLELDDYKNLLTNTKQVLADIEVKEKEKTNISSLRISYNKVIGYYITVSKSYLKLVPDYYIRKQTLVNAERFITPELKELEEKIIGAQQSIDDLERSIYEGILDKLISYSSNLINISKNIAYLDMIMSFAQVSHGYNYCKPEFNDYNILQLKESRHPVVEQIEPNFSANDIYMDTNDYIHIITGPNLSGKSTYMRQIALNQIMAQIGCFVPASFASLHLVDRVFTRIGASDFLSRGESTFMVEMLETANILNNATSKSLIILDEIGRGTSTFDGIAIAYSVVDYLVNNIKAKTLFATHYHQLNKMAQNYDAINNYNVLVKDNKDDVIFLHKIVKGGTNKSYGIHVAKLAGLPSQVIKNSLNLINKIDLKDNIADKIFQDFKKTPDVIEDVNKSNDSKFNNKKTKSILDF